MTVSIFQGDVDLYISNSWASRPVLGYRADIDSSVVVSFNFSSTGVGTAGEDILVPKSAVQQLCASRGSYCYLLIGVFGAPGSAVGLNSDPGSVQRFNQSEGEVQWFQIRSSAADSSYSILVTSKASIVTLINGIPVRGKVAQEAAQYYMFTMTSPKTDLVISVTPLYGDPDLYVSFYPVTHPTRSNYSYAAASFGADTLTLQVSMLSPFCIPDLSIGKACDIYIGVLGWQNSSYTLEANLNNGFESRISLMDGQPQTGAVAVGMYVYYEYQVGSASSNKNNPLRFSLSSLSGSDLDLFLTFKNQSSTGKSSDNNIPGLSRHDYYSTNMDGASDEILVSPGDPLFCTGCTVYLAVYGFRGLEADGEYILIASSGEVEELPQGRVTTGMVVKGSYRYYSFHNEDSLAHISIALTMQTGDADLCVSTYNPSGTQISNPLSSSYSSSSREHIPSPLLSVLDGDLDRLAIVLPTMQSSTWRSMHFGDDVLHINYDDKDFCYNCDYIIGVFGYKNSSYTLLTVTSEDVMTKLLPNIALEVASEVGGTKYFSVGALNSADDILFSVTSLDNGEEDLYVQVYQNDSILSTGRVLLNTSDPRTYMYTTKGTPLDVILVKGPHVQGSTFVIAVQATHINSPRLLDNTSVLASASSESSSPSIFLSRTRYTILASYSQQHVLLSSGVPQNHFVSKGDTEFFRFIPEGNTDMRISLTARSGDPDMLVSSDFEFPRCNRGGDSQIFNCTNYTWLSRQYSSDQIIISRDYPCEAVLSSTEVSSTCNSSTSYQPDKHKAVNIGVYGYYKNTVFTIMASPVGSHSQLTAGTAMESTAFPTFECSQRDTDSGTCLPSSAVKRQVLAAYFSFTVISSGEAVVITVVPSCNTSSSSFISPSLSSAFEKKDKGCPAGCDCSPLRVYITSCVKGHCTEYDRSVSQSIGRSGYPILLFISHADYFSFCTYVKSCYSTGNQ